MTAEGQAVGIAVHPYLHVEHYYSNVGSGMGTSTAVRYSKTIWRIAAQQGDTRCQDEIDGGGAGASDAPWWCDGGDEGMRNGDFYGNGPVHNDHMNVRATNYYAENDFYWCLQRDSNSQSPDPTRPAC